MQGHIQEGKITVYLCEFRSSSSLVQVVKLFLDPVTFQKVKFVYPNNEESLELMRKFFYVETLPVEFGGKCNTQYNHEEYSLAMNKDEMRSATLVG